MRVLGSVGRRRVQIIVSLLKERQLYKLCVRHDKGHPISSLGPALPCRECFRCGLLCLTAWKFFWRNSAIGDTTIGQSCLFEADLSAALCQFCGCLWTGLPVVLDHCTLLKDFCSFLEQGCAVAMPPPPRPSRGHQRKSTEVAIRPHCV